MFSSLSPSPERSAAGPERVRSWHALALGVAAFAIATALERFTANGPAATSLASAIPPGSGILQVLDLVTMENELLGGCAADHPAPDDFLVP